VSEFVVNVQIGELTDAPHSEFALAVVDPIVTIHW
jgi:hypothetical protein